MPSLPLVVGAGGPRPMAVGSTEAGAIPPLQMVLHVAPLGASLAEHGIAVVLSLREAATVRAAVQRGLSGL